MNPTLRRALTIDMSRFHRVFSLAKRVYIRKRPTIIAPQQEDSLEQPANFVAPKWAMFDSHGRGAPEDPRRWLKSGETDAGAGTVASGWVFLWVLCESADRGLGVYQLLMPIGITLVHEYHARPLIGCTDEEIIAIGRAVTKHAGTETPTVEQSFRFEDITFYKYADPNSSEAEIGSVLRTTSKTCQTQAI